MKKLLAAILILALSTTTASASMHLATYEQKKGVASVTEVKAWDPDVKMCINWLESDAGLYCRYYCKTYNNEIDPTVIAAQIYYESRFTPTIVSSGGAVGLMQVIPSCAQPFMNEVGAVNLFNTCDNLRVGIAEDLYWLHQSSTLREALAKYNGGYSGSSSSRCLNYADRIIYLSERIREVRTYD